MATSCESFLKIKYPEILKEFKEYQAIEKKAEKEKEEKKLEKERKTAHFWEFEFVYDVEFSYKGFTSSSDTKYMDFEEAWRIISKKELRKEYDIIPYSDIHLDLLTEPGLSFEEYLDEEGLDEDKVKTALHNMLYDKPNDTLQEEVEDRYDWDAKVSSNVEWDGAYIFTENYFNDVWKDFKNCRFMKTPKKSKK